MDTLDWGWCWSIVWLVIKGCTWLFPTGWPTTIKVTVSHEGCSLGVQVINSCWGLVTLLLLNITALLNLSLPSSVSSSILSVRFYNLLCLFLFTWIKLSPSTETLALLKFSLHLRLSQTLLHLAHSLCKVLWSYSCTFYLSKTINSLFPVCTFSYLCKQTTKCIHCSLKLPFTFSK